MQQTLGCRALIGKRFRPVTSHLAFWGATPWLLLAQTPSVPLNAAHITLYDL